MSQVYQVIYLQHNAPERVVGYITGNSPRHALAIARHSPKYGDYDPDRLTVAVAPPKKPGQAPQKRTQMQPEQMLLKLAKELLATDLDSTVRKIRVWMKKNIGGDSWKIRDTSAGIVVSYDCGMGFDDVVELRERNGIMMSELWVGGRKYKDPTFEQIVKSMDEGRSGVCADT